MRAEPEEGSIMRRVDESESLISDLGGRHNNDRKQSVLQAVV